MIKKEKKSLVWTIVLVSAFQMGMVALSPVISAITVAFPQISDVTAQMATTFLNLVLTATALFSGSISKKIGRRAMCAIGMGCYVIAGVCGWLFSFSIVMIYLWSAILGIGTGLFVPAVSSMMVDYFPDDARQTLVGFQTASVNIGGMILSYGAGFFAKTTWNHAYLMYLLALPVFFMAIKFVPLEEKAKSEDITKTASDEKVRVPAVVLWTSLKTFIFAVIYFTFSTNVSLMLTEKGFSDTSVSGLAMALFMLGGAASGLAFKSIYGHAKKYTAFVAFSMLIISFAGIFFFDNLILLYIASFIGGTSLSIIFPFYIVTVGNQLSPEVSVISTSLILSVTPNFGSFVSPIIITNLAKLVTGSNLVVNRFITSAVLALICAVVLLIMAKHEQ